MSEVGKIITNIEPEKLKLDHNARRLLSNRFILSKILQRCCPEYRGMELSAIQRFIEPKSIKLEVLGLDPADSAISGESNENIISGEGKVIFDIIFTARIPNSKNKIDLYINLEAQASDNEEDLLPRGFYYCSRVISRQYGKEVIHGDYSGLKKVYSIWICLNNKKRAGKITGYKMEKEDIEGVLDEEQNRYDFIRIVTIGLRDAYKEDDDSLVSMLSLIFSQKIKVAIKCRLLTEKYGMNITNEIKEVIKVCSVGEYLIRNYTDGIFAQGRNEGIALGRNEGIALGRNEGIAQGELDATYNLVLKTKARLKSSLDAAMDFFDLSPEMRASIKNKAEHEKIIDQ